MDPDIRWKQRFDNFDRALGLLREAVSDVTRLSPLEKEGTVQRFEFTVELAWKTLKDYLESTGIVLAQITPKSVVKAAFAARMIADGQLWVDMLDCRNALAHTYDAAMLDEAVQAIATRFVPGLQALHRELGARRES